MPKNTDLRVFKTKRAIRTAFLQLLRKKDVAQISVVELARCAEINKSTFYLHYSDIYALYTEVLTDYVYREAAQFAFCAQLRADPEAFVRGFFHFPAHLSDPIEKCLFRPENLSHCQGLLPLLIDAVSESIFSSGMLSRTEETVERLRFLLGGMYALAIASGSSPNPVPDSMVSYIAGQFRASFPELSASPGPSHREPLRQM